MTISALLGWCMTGHHAHPTLPHRCPGSVDLGRGRTNVCTCHCHTHR